MLKRKRDGSKHCEFLWIHMIPQFLYLEELINLRQVMKLTRFAKGISASECPIGVFNYENYQDVCETINSNSALHFNETDIGSRRKFKIPEFERWMTQAKCWTMLKKLKIEPNMMRKYTCSSEQDLHFDVKSFVSIRNSKNRKTFVQRWPNTVKKTSAIYIEDTSFLQSDVILNTFYVSDEYIKINFKNPHYERALTVNNVHFDIMGKPLSDTSFRFHLEIDVYNQSSIQITSNASIITLDHFTSNFDPCQFGNNNNLNELRLICYDPTDLQLCVRIQEALRFNGEWFHLELLHIQLKNKDLWNEIELKALKLNCLIKIDFFSREFFFHFSRMDCYQYFLIIGTKEDKTQELHYERKFFRNGKSDNSWFHNQSLTKISLALNITREMNLNNAQNYSIHLLHDRLQDELVKTIKMMRFQLENLNKDNWEPTKIHLLKTMPKTYLSSIEFQDDVRELEFYTTLCKEWEKKGFTNVKLIYSEHDVD
jgi:hypothetical protein